MITRETIYAQIDAERRRQNQQWGGTIHDDGHKRRTWRRLLREHVERTVRATGDNWRHRLVVIAAIAIAAIEAHDRKEGLS